jgi:hypothetical protein
LTRAGSKDACMVQEVLDEVAATGTEVVTGLVAQTGESFRSTFEATTGGVLPRLSGWYGWPHTSRP